VERKIRIRGKVATMSKGGVFVTKSLLPVSGEGTEVKDEKRNEMEARNWA